MTPEKIRSTHDGVDSPDPGIAEAPPPIKGKRKTPSPSQRLWLSRGLDQAGGKLPLFLDDGQRVSERTVKSCIQNGWAEPRLKNPLKPGWQMCRLTTRGRAALAD